MSYGISIGNYEVNLTFNISPMLYKSFGGKNPLKEFAGRKAKFLEKALATRVIPYFLKHRKSLEKLNPQNGWGSYEGTLKVLIEVYFACHENPNEKFNNWY